MTALEDAYEFKMTVSEARKLGDDEGDLVMNGLLNVIDEAQAEVHMGNVTRQAIVIWIIRDAGAE